METIMHTIRRTLAFCSLIAVVLAMTAGVASAQQLVDASEKGDVAFDVFAGMCILFVAIMFAIDRVRHRD
jgi:ABC-type proline/glycine betaine transport system permease subunit